MSESLKNKLSARDYRHVHQLSNGPLEVLIGTKSLLNASERSNLEAAGFVPIATVGQIIAGQLKDLEALERVANLEFIDRVEISRQMESES